MFDPTYDYYALDPAKLPLGAVWLVDTKYVREHWVVWGGIKRCVFVLLKPAYWKAVSSGPDNAA